MSLKSVATVNGNVYRDTKGNLWLPVEVIADMVRTDRASVLRYLEEKTKVYNRKTDDGAMLQVVKWDCLLLAAAHFRPTLSKAIAEVGLIPYLEELTGLELDRAKSIDAIDSNKSSQIVNREGFGIMLSLDDMLERLKLELDKDLKNEVGRIMSIIVSRRGEEKQQTRKRVRDGNGNYQSYPVNLYSVDHLDTVKTIAETMIEAVGSK